MEKKHNVNWVQWILLDGALIFASFLAAYWLRFHTVFSGSFAHKTADLFLPYLKLSITAVTIWLLIFKTSGFYRERRFPSFINDLQKILECVFWGTLFLAGAIFLYHEFSFSRFVAGSGSFLSFLALASSRALKRYFEKKKNGKTPPKRTIIVGCGRNGEIILKRLRRNSVNGFQPVGFLDDKARDAGGSFEGVKILGRIEALPDIIAAERIDEVIVTLGCDEWCMAKYVAAVCQRKGVDFLILPDLNEPLFTSTEVEVMHGIPLIGLKESFLKRPGGRFLKRCVDAVFSLVLIVILLPLFAVIAAAIRLTSPGPVFFRQDRIGYNNKTFSIFKFRTMAQDCGGPSWTDKADTRCTAVGKFLRRTNLDELPQLFNAFIGDMSLIGPRPLALDDTEFQKFRFFSWRHKVKPGLTGWAQVNGLRGGHIEPEERIRYDLYYIDNWSVWLDITILFMTPFALLNAF